MTSRGITTLIVVAFLVTVSSTTVQADEHLEPDPSTYLGGSELDHVYDVAVGPDGALYASGITFSPDFPGAERDPRKGDLFIAKLSPDAGEILWSHVLGGDETEWGYAVAVGRDAVYVTGVTESEGFPTSASPDMVLYDGTYNGGNTDAVLIRLSHDGEIQWSTFYGGASEDWGRDLELSPEGKPVIVGYTASCDFHTLGDPPYREPPTCSGSFSGDAFAARFWPQGTLNRATLLGGSDTDIGYGMGIVPHTGEVWVAGETMSTDLPTDASSYRQERGDGFHEGFLARLGPGLERLEYATYLGDAIIRDAAADVDGAGYAVGYTSNESFPTTAGAYQTESNGNLSRHMEGVLVKIDQDGAPVYSTFIGGNDTERLLTVEADTLGRAYVGGETRSDDFGNHSDDRFDNAMLLRLSADGTALEDRVVYGGSFLEETDGIAFGPDGVWTAGDTGSSDYPTTPGAADREKEDDFVSKGFVTHFAMDVPPPPIEFDHRGGNEWWVEVSTTGAPVGAVEARDANHAWTPLSFRDWGNWAGSFHIEPGNEVQFRAMSHGQWVFSCYFTHPDGVSQCPADDSGFDADFRDPRGNEWWLEVDVVSDAPVASVDVMLDGGDPKPLEHKDWGSWAESYHAPEGTTVQFIATSTTGDTDRSACYRWTSAEVVACDDDGDTGDDTGDDTGGDGDTDSFAVDWNGVKGNEWWIQTSPSSDHAITSVDVTLDGGEPKPLEKESWGWAASYHAPEGTIVQFIATSSGGATNTSGCYRWTAAEPVSCDGTGDGDGAAPVFDHVTGNEWWVEVTVTEGPTRVQAMDTSGAWVELEHKDWGVWAASFHIEPGHDVRFQAEVDGTWYESCWFTHPDGTAEGGGATCTGSAA